MKYLYNPATDSFEALEPTLRDRFALGTPRRGLVTEPGGYSGKPGSIAAQILEPSKEIRNFLKKTYPNITFNFKNYPLYGIGTDSKDYNKVRERVTRKFRPEIYEGVKKEKRIAGAEASFGKDKLNILQRTQLNGVKAGILYQQALNNIIKNKGRGLSTSEKNELRFTLQNNKKFMKLIKDAGFDNVNDFISSGYAKTKENFVKIKGINEGKKIVSSQELGKYITDNTPRGKKLKQSIIARKKLLNDWLNKNVKDKKQIKQIKTTGDFIETREVRDRPIDKFRQGQTTRYRKFLDAGFSSDEARKLWDNKPGSSKQFHRPTLINNSLGIGDNATLRFNRSHYFPIMAAGELKNKNLLASNTFYSDRFTYRPAYINQLQKFFYDQPVLSDIGKHLRGTITKKELDKSLATRAKNFTDTFDIDVDQLKLNKNGKFEFVNKNRPSVTGGTFANRIPLIKNAIQELKNTINIQGAGLLDAKEIEMAKLKFPDVNVDSVAKDFFNPKIPQETYELLKQKPGLNKRIMEVRNQDIKSGAATQKTNKSFLFKSFMDKASPFVKKVPGSSVALAPIDFFLMTSSGAPMNEALLSAGSYFLKDPLIGKAVNMPLAMLAQQREYKETGEFKPIFNMQAGEDKLRGLIDKVKEKFGDDAPIGTADEAPEPESAERKRMFDDFNERFGDTNEMEISDIDNPFMAAMGGRVGFKDGTPNPLIQELLSGLNNTEVMDNVLKNNTPGLEESMFGTKEESNLLQRLNQTLDPRAFPYYAAQLTKGVALAPEFAARFTLAAPKALADLAQGKSGVGAEFAENIDPKVTQKQVVERFGLQKILDDMDQDITGSQRTVGEILKMGGESLGPATGVGYFASAGKAANQIRKEIQKYAGSAQAAKELERSVEEKASSLQMTRREFNTLLAGGGIMGLIKALGLDTIFPAAKTVAQKAAPKVVTAGGTPKYFFDFVNLIKTKGKDITDKAATVERQKVYDYNGYTLYEDITTGKINIRKDTEGGAQFSTPDGQTDTYETLMQESIEYKPSEIIQGKDGKPVKVPDEYDEMTAGKSEDAEPGLDSIDEILELLSKDGKSYSLKELEEMGLNTEALKVRDYKFKPEKAGGGIIKLAGDDSGPPPKSGPTPHGLPYIAKNVRPIKERK